MQDDFVVVYDQSNYKGNALTLKSNDSSNTLISIESLTVPIGFAVTFFSDSAYTTEVESFEVHDTCYNDYYHKVLSVGSVSLFPSRRVAVACSGSICELRICSSGICEDF